jgi:hypothetical protein
MPRKAEGTPDERLVRKRLNARHRQQRCRARMRDAADIETKRFHAQLDSINTSKTPAVRPTRGPCQQPANTMSYPPGMRFPQGPYRPGMMMMVPAHAHAHPMMMMMHMGMLPMHNRPFLAPNMPASRPVTVSRSATEEFNNNSLSSMNKLYAPKEAVKPSPKTEAAAIDAMLSLRSNSSSDSESDVDSFSKKMVAAMQSVQQITKSPPKRKAVLAKHTRPTPVFMPGPMARAMHRSAPNSMRWPTGRATNIPTMKA